MNNKNQNNDCVVVQSQEKKNQNHNAQDATHGAIIAENIIFQKTLQSTIDEGLKDMTSQAQRYKKNTLDQRNGLVFEADHTTIFNIRKAMERDSTRAFREANGNHGDVKIVEDGKVSEFEMKNYGSAEKTENAMRGYPGKQLVGPSDQTEEIKAIARKKSAKGLASPKESRQKVGREHEAVRKNVSDSITDGKTKSTPRTRKESKKITRKATKGKLDAVDVLPPLGESLKLAVKSGATSGAEIGASMTVFTSGRHNIYAWKNGEKNGTDAIVDAAKDIAISGLDSGVKGAVGSGATVLATNVAAKVGSKVLQTTLRSSAPATVAIALVEVGKDAFDLANGKIDGKEFGKKTVKTAVTTSGGWAGAEAGAVLGTMVGGPVGAVVGGLVGGIAGSLGAGKLLGWFC